MSTREEMIKMAEAKWAREENIRLAEEKWERENAPATGDPTPKSLMDDDDDLISLGMKTLKKIGELARKPENRAIQVGIEKGATLSARPAVAGLGAGAGAVVGSLEEGKGLGESLSAGKEAFKEARSEANIEQADLAKQFPGRSMVGEAIGTIATAPLTPIKSLFGAAKVGAIGGAGQAAGEAESLGEAAEMIGTGAAFGAGTELGAKGVQKGFQAVKKTYKTLIPEKALTKIGHALSGVPEKDIQTYAKQTDEVNKIIKQYQGNIPEAADVARQKLRDSISSTKQKLNDEITSALAAGEAAELKAGWNVKPKKPHRTKPIIDQLERIKKQLHPVTKEAQRGEVDHLISLIKKMESKGGVGIKDLFEIWSNFHIR